jgi:hypothetical protein
MEHYSIVSFSKRLKIFATILVDIVNIIRH